MTHRRRALLVLLFLSLGFTLISCKLVRIQLIEHEMYRHLAMMQDCKRVTLPARRGLILDANGQILAQTQILHAIHVDGRNVLDAANTLAGMERILGVASGALAKGFKPTDRYQLLYEKATEEQVAALKDFEAAKIAAWSKAKQAPQRFLMVEDRYRRSYPNGAYASHLIGFLNAANEGVSGVEGAMDASLRGIPGGSWIEKDPRGREIAGYRGRDQQPVDGSNVVLTIDLGVQHVLEEGADKLVQKYHPAGVYLIAMRPKTGEILGMTNRPTFDPNNRQGVPLENFRDRCLTDRLEPGSIFKIVTIAAALNEGVVSLDNEIYCENGSFFYADHVLHDDEPNGTLTVEQVLAKSSNIGCAKLGLQLGEARLYDYARRFGFGVPTGMLPHQGEVGGVLRPLSAWSKLSVTRIPMGQEVAATPLQMVTAMSVIANRGSLVQPRLVQQITDEDRRVVQYFPPHVIRRVISEEAAKQVAFPVHAHQHQHWD